MSFPSHPRWALAVLWMISLPSLIQTLAATSRVQLSSPLEYQVIQRGPVEGFIPVRGTVLDVDRLPDVVEARWVGAEGTSGGSWEKLRLRGSAFGGGLMAPAGGWYRVEIRAQAANATVAATQVAHVGVGEIFVITGQSNSANHGEELQEPKSGKVVTLHNGKWQPARDPQPGASGGGGSFIPPLGDLLAGRLQVPVGFVAVGVGATSVREWLPAGTSFVQPPTITGNVTRRADGTWEAKGALYQRLVDRMQELGPRGFRAVLWHQGESDANQADPSRTLPGPLYQKFLTQLIRDSQKAIGWDAPWFVALVSYHTPTDTGSTEIRNAQQALWRDGTALAGPDSDALVGDFRDGAGKGIHFSGKGLREHAARWAELVLPWLDRQMLTAGTPRLSPPPKLVLPGENFPVAGRPAFVYLPPPHLRSNPQPWIFYGPTLPPYPDEGERWMHEKFLAAGIAVAGVDVGEAYGSPKSHAVFDALYEELVLRGFAARPCLFGRSRGGLWTSSWAIHNPARIAGLIGIYPVFDFRTYPGVDKAAPAYGLSTEELLQRAPELNPIERIDVLARARIPVKIIHGDIDKVVPLAENSARFQKTYAAAGAGDLIQVIVVAGQGHNMYEGFFHSQELVDFAIARARAGTR